MPETLDASSADASSPMSRRGLIKHATVAGAATVAAGLALNAGLAGAAAAGKLSRHSEHHVLEKLAAVHGPRRRRPDW